MLLQKILNFISEIILELSVYFVKYVGIFICIIVYLIIKFRDRCMYCFWGAVIPRLRNLST